MWKISPIFITCILSIATPVLSANAFRLPTHKLITEKALHEMGYNTGAIRHLVWNNFKMDLSIKSFRAHHFDNESFEESSALLRFKFSAALSELQQHRPRQARKLIGGSLHTVQDFYSHSNFVENHEIDDPIDLFNLKNPDPKAPCDPVTRIGALTTGYFPKKLLPSAWKCTHDEINKDTKKRPYFAKAVLFATDASIAYLKRFEAALAAQVNDEAQTEQLLEELKKTDEVSIFDALPDPMPDAGDED
jgi:hypothetical protein